MHCRLLMLTNAKPNFDDMKAYLLNVDHETTLADEDEMDKPCDLLKRLLKQLDIASLFSACHTALQKKLIIRCVKRRLIESRSFGTN